jgi:large subunit ribosomal protein L3
MGTQQVTVKNLPVVDIDQANNLLYIKGALPGAINSLLEIKVIKEVKAEKK